MSESPFRSHFRQLYSTGQRGLMRGINQSAPWTRKPTEHTKPAPLRWGRDTKRPRGLQQRPLWGRRQTLQGTGCAQCDKGSSEATAGVLALRYRAGQKVPMFFSMQDTFFIFPNNVTDLDIFRTSALSRYWLLVGRGWGAAKHLPQQRIIWQKCL